MAYRPLSELNDWHLVHPEQDIRGYKVMDTDGRTIGRVDDLLVNTDSELVESIRLDDGEEYPAREIEICDGTVYLAGTAPRTEATTEPIVQTYRETRVRRAEM